jgi:hypothetical protein
MLVGKPDRGRPHGRPKRRWEDNIKRDLKEIGWEAVNSIDLTRGMNRWRALVDTVINFRIP